MSLIFWGKGDAHIAICRKDENGNIISESPARWEHNPDGGCVIVGKLNADTMEQEGTADVFGDWDATGYLGKVMEYLNPSRKINVPDLKEIVQNAAREGDEDFICQHCSADSCRDCIVNEWQEEVRQ